jgi:hypothetical protein
VPEEIIRGLRVLALDFLVALEKVGEGDFVTTLQAMTRLGVKNEVARRHLIEQARATGTSWAVIGEALGIPRQAAWRRYKGPDSESSQEDFV